MKPSFTLAALVLLPLSAAPSFAQCAPEPIADGEVVTCTGTDSDGFSSAFNNLSITVETGSAVSGTAPGFVLTGTGIFLYNNGTIASTGTGGSAEGIDGRDGLTISNTGTISSLNSRAIDADDRNNLRIANTGTITALNKAIRNGDGSNGSLDNSGTIFSATNEGYETGDNASVVNFGTIEAQDDAVQVGQNAQITNFGTIRSFRNLTPGAEQQDAIDIDSGQVTNFASGIIESEANAGIDFDGSDILSAIQNEGRISGTTGILVDKGESNIADANTATQYILNFGIIEGYDGLAIDVGAGDDILSLYPGSTLIGGADMGDDNDTLVLFDELAGNIANGSVLDGGADIDLVDFVNLTIGDVARAVFDGSVFRLRLKTPTTSYSVALRNWEEYRFGADTYDRDQILAVAPVPLPAAGLMLLAGLGGLSLLRRRYA